MISIPKNLTGPTTGQEGDHTMKLEASLIEVKEVFKEIMLKPETMFDMLDINIKSIAERSITELLKVELTYFLGRGKYERSNK
jgi:hypothetical protein